MNTDNNDLNDSSADIAAAFATVSANEGAAPAAPAPLVTEEMLPPSNGQAARDANGRFVSPGAVSPAPGAPQDPTPGVSPTPTPDGQPGAPGAVPGAPAAPGAPVAADPNAPAVFDKAKPPSAWTPEMKAQWDTIPEAVRAEITRREEASYQGFEKFRKQVEPAMGLYDAMSQHEQYFRHIKVPTENYKDYMDAMVQTEQTLVFGNPAQKLQKIVEIGDEYGIPLRQILDGALNGGLDELLATGHKNFNSPTPLPPELQKEMQELRSFRSKYEQDQAAAQLQRMQADTARFPLLEEVSDAMADVLEKGQAKTLEEAYDYAVWRDPALRAKAQGVVNGQVQQSSVQQRQAAAAAVASPAASAAAVGKGNPVEESMEETIRRAMQANSGGANRA